MGVLINRGPQPNTGGTTALWLSADRLPPAANHLKSAGIRVLHTPSAAAAWPLLRAHRPGVFVLDLDAPGSGGLETIQQAQGHAPAMMVLVITSTPEAAEAVRAIKAGAADYLSKPVSAGPLAEMARATAPPDDDESLAVTMGPSDAIASLSQKVNLVAQSDFTVIVTGETGAGKELVARAIHRASHRRDGPFVPIDCGAIPEALLESELFGHEKGAFTGAIRQKLGKFEQARNGTLFLDEISNMTLGSQAKLLRVLQEKTIWRVGGSDPFEVDVRILVACNQELGPDRQGAFRQDLYYRLNEFTVRVPALRERPDDILYLANRFRQRANQELGRHVRGFSVTAQEAMLGYRWPGNVRELIATVRRAVLVAGEEITVSDLDLAQALKPTPIRPLGEGDDLWGGRSLKAMVKTHIMAVEREILNQTLEHTGGNKAQAARLLQIDYKTMLTKLKKTSLQ